VGIGSTQPVRRSNRPSGIPRMHRPASRSCRAALHGLALPCRVHHRDPAPSRRPAPEGDDRHGRRRFLSWTFVALRHSLGPVDPSSSADPSTGAYRVRGLATPCATSTTDPPDTFVSERPWASPFKAFSSIAIGAPLGALAFLALPAAPAPPEEGQARRGRLQGLSPATSSFCHRDHK
jgi:hypothetical protein